MTVSRQTITLTVAAAAKLEPIALFTQIGSQHIDGLIRDRESVKAREALVAGRDIVALLVAQFSEQPQLEQDPAWFDQQIGALKDLALVPN
jgi:hypothetical protein